MFRRRQGGEEPVQQGGQGPLGRRGGDGGRYRMRQKLVSFGDDYWIENAQGRRVFFVDGKAFRVREHLAFKDMQGNELAAIQEKVMRVKDTYSIYRNGQVLATVKKALITPLRQRFDVHVAGGENMEAQGNILDHGGRGLEEVVPGCRHLRRRHRPWCRRYPDPRHYGGHRYDGRRREIRVLFALRGAMVRHEF